MKYYTPLAQASLMVCLFLTMSPAVFGQARQFDNNVFSFKIHDALLPEPGENDHVYKSSTIFLDIDEVDTWDNANKYMDALEYKFLDDYDTETGHDSLGGWPVNYLKTFKKSDIGTYVQEYFIFDNGKKVFVISISGWAADERIVRSYFDVTRQSFAFKTRQDYIGQLYMDVPAITGEDNNIIWSRVYNPGEPIEIPVRYNHDEQNHKSVADDRRKLLKKEKAYDVTDSTYMVGDIEVIRIVGTIDKKLNDGIRKPETTVRYYIKHPSGGTSFVFYSASPKVAPILLSATDAMVQTARVNRL